LSLQATTQQNSYPRIVDVSTNPTTDETYIKAFLMDDTVNKNYWHIPTNVMKKYASSFIGRPFIYHPSGNHPDYFKEGAAHDSDQSTFIADILNIQDKYKIGDIIDVTYEPIKEQSDKKAWFSTIKISNKEILAQIKSGAVSSFVSPQVYDLKGSGPNEQTTEFIPLHLAIVNEPAYGNKARIKAQCNGSGPTCLNALKSAAFNFANALDNSSFLKNLGNNTDKTLTNPIYQQPIDPNQQYQQPIVANQGYNPFNNQQPQQGQYVDQNGQLISQKTQTQEVDANGNLITRTEDKKPKAQQKPAQTQGQNIIADPQAQAQQNLQTPPAPPAVNPQAQPVQTAPAAITPVTPDVPATPQLPAEFVEMMKGMQATLTGVTERLNNVENFKKSAEDEKVKAASEAQRKIIESVFTPEVIADENARQNVIEKFVSLPLSDEDLKMILDMIVSGTFNNSAPAKKAVPQNNGPPQVPGGVKGASVNSSLIMRQIADSRRTTNPSMFTQRFFSDVDASNL
jgi:hypothetical protein